MATAVLLAAQAIPGPEFGVNVTTAGFQISPAVAMDSTGAFVVAWASADNNLENSRVVARRYDAAGNALTGELLVNPAFEQYAPSVATDAAGNFVIVWQGSGDAGAGIYGRLYDAAGVPKADQFVVEPSFGTNVQRVPIVRMAAAGNFTVIWQGVTASCVGICGKQFGADASPIDAAFQINTQPAMLAPPMAIPRAQMSMAMSPAGDFIVVYEHQPGLGHGRAFGRHFGADGTPTGADVPLTTSIARLPKVAMNDSRFVLAWTGENFNGHQFAQVFDLTLAPLTPPIEVDTASIVQPGINADVGIDSAGNFTVIWHGGNPATDEDDLFGRQFDASGTPLADEAIVSTSFSAPALGMNGGGNFVVAFERFDGDRSGVFARRYSAPGAPPSCTAYAGSVNAGGTLSGHLVCADPDPGASLTVSVVGTPAFGLVTVGPNGDFTYTAAQGFVGQESFTFRATDNHGSVSNVAQAVIDVLDNPPICADFAGQTPPRVTLHGSVTCTDPDFGDTIEISIVGNAQHGTLTMNGDGTFSYAPEAGYIGPDSFTYRARDRHAEFSNIAAAAITVDYRPPSCIDVNASIHAGEEFIVNLSHCSDPDGDAFTLNIVSNPAHGVLNQSPVSSLLFYRPNSGFFGTDTFTYRARDGRGAFSNVATVTIAVVNRSPSCRDFAGSVHSGVGSVLSGIKLSLPALCSDAESHSFTLAVVSGPSHGIVGLMFAFPDRFEYTPFAGFTGTDTFTFRATDAFGAVSNITTVTIAIQNQPPRCNNYAAAIESGDDHLGPTPCSDPDGDPLTFEVVSRPSHGSAGLGFAFPNRFHYTPFAGFIGTDTFTFRATDSIGAVSNVATATIDVVPNTPAGSNVRVSPSISVKVTFSSVTSPGITTAIPSFTGPPPPGGFQVPVPDQNSYWDISTTAVYTPPVEVCLVWPTTITNPRLLHFVNGVGVDVTTRVDGAFVCGNVNSLSPFVVAEPVDTTPPVTSVAAAPEPNDDGWNLSDVTVALSTSDPQGGSGVAEIAYSAAGAQPIALTTVAGSAASISITAEGTTTVTFFAKDQAGNIEQPQTLVVRLDKSAPTITCRVAPTVIWPPNHNLVPVTAVVTVSDGGSGPAGFTLTSVTSNEPDNGLGDGDQQNDIQGFAIGAADTEGRLRAERSGRGSGRVYTLTYVGRDTAGNSSTCEAGVIVPHDRK
jgi:hypothetical protein